MEIVTTKPVDPGTMFEKIRKSKTGFVLLHSGRGLMESDGKPFLLAC